MTIVGFSKSKQNLLSHSNESYDTTAASFSFIHGKSNDSKIIERKNATNLSIAGTTDRLPKITRKVPLKTFSLTTNLHRATSTSGILPDYEKHKAGYTNYNEYSKKANQPSIPKRSSFLATEKGNGDLLPTSTSDSNFLNNRSRTTSNLTTVKYGYNATSGASRSRTLTDSISQAWSSTRRIRGRPEEDELPLHTQVKQYDEALRNNRPDVSITSLRSRRSRTTTLDRDELEQNGNGYASMDGSNHDRVGRTFSSIPNTSWLPWSSNTSQSDSGSSRIYKLGRRRSKGNSEYLLPLTMPSPACVGSQNRNRTFQCYSKTISQSNWIQTLIVIVATYLVWHSYQRTQTIQSRLEIFNDKESLSMLHLKTVEQHLIHLHENVARLNDISANVDNMNIGLVGGPDNSKKEAVDSNLIRVQTQQLYQMEEELDHELRSLQTKIQQVARSSIVTTFGEGPVQVVLELDFRDTDRTSSEPISSDPLHDSISILLWYDTPHGAWTWIEQIRKGFWQSASFQIGKGAFTVDANPSVSQEDKRIQDDNDDSSLKFVEKSKKTHEPWTVGLTYTDKGMGMFINLQDNSDLHKHHVCVGKVIDGFDALQRLVDTSRRLEGSGRVVYIKNAVATHLSRVQTQALT